MLSTVKPGNHFPVSNREKLTLIAGAHGSFGTSFEHIALVDINGDGLADQVGQPRNTVADCDGLSVFLNSGSRFLQPQCWPGLPSMTPVEVADTPIGGLLDGLSNTMPSVLSAGIHGGTGLSAGPSLAVSNASLNGITLSGQVNPSARSRTVVDVNGDGLG